MSDKPAQLSILTFHAIDNQQVATALEPEIFDHLIYHLYKSNIKATTIRNALQDFPILPAPTVLSLSFDDGYANIYEPLITMYNQYGFVATIFLTLGQNGSITDLFGYPTLNWKQIKHLHALGFEIGAHTLNHPILPLCDKAILKHEVVDAKHMIEDRLGDYVTSFAYPYGRYNSHIIDLVSQHYKIAVTTNLRQVRPKDSLYELPRIDTVYFQTPTLHRVLTHPLLPYYLKVRATGRYVKRVLSAIIEKPSTK